MNLSGIEELARREIQGRADMRAGIDINMDVVTPAHRQERFFFAVTLHNESGRTVLGDIVKTAQFPFPHGLSLRGPGPVRTRG